VRSKDDRLIVCNGGRVVVHSRRDIATLSILDSGLQGRVVTLVTQDGRSIPLRATATGPFGRRRSEAHLSSLRTWLHPRG
jgi:hypothetical protein